MKTLLLSLMLISGLIFANTVKVDTGDVKVNINDGEVDINAGGTKVKTKNKKDQTETVIIKTGKNQKIKTGKEKAKLIVMNKNNQTFNVNCRYHNAKIKGNNNTMRVFNCNEVTIIGDNNEIKISNLIEKYTVKGNNNDTKIKRKVSHIIINGNNNDTTFKKIKNFKPSIKQKGSNNDVSKDSGK